MCKAALHCVVVVSLSLAAPMVSVFAQTGRMGSYQHTESGRDLLDVDLMFVGAHPDDDSGIMGTFARYSLDEGFKSTVTTFTGGDGGGNATGREAGRALALIRQEEERRALAMIGVDSPHFLGKPDFYFTLSAEETEKKWGADFVCDLVRIVRLERPEVIITMWPGPGTHGQHQMAARAATFAFDKASDIDTCPGQLHREGLEPFQPLKLYYYNRQGEGMVEIPTSDHSRTNYRRYADIKALAMSMYRSQGFDQFLNIPVDEARPERFMLVRSMVPVSEPETHLLAGALVPAGASPAGVEMRIEPTSYNSALGVAQEVSIVVANRTHAALSDFTLRPEPVDGWTITPTSTPTTTIAAGDSLTLAAMVTATPEATTDRNTRVSFSYRAELEGQPISGTNYAWLKAVAPVRVTFQPLYDVAGYRAFARDTNTEWVIESLPTRIPLTIGKENPVGISVENRSEGRAHGTLDFELPEGVTLPETPEYDLGPFEQKDLIVSLRVTEDVLSEGRHAAKLPLRVKTTVGGQSSEDSADVYALPFLVVPKAASAPTIDGDLSDMATYPGSDIGPNDRWWRRPPESAADSSARFHVAYDDRFIYVGAQIRDDAVICNIAPNDIRAQLRSDAIGITIDPTGTSRDTSTVIQAAAFPCTTQGFGARGFRDADANQGPMEETAPGMRVASRKTEDGYDFEAAIPWDAMPHHPSPGDELAMNIVIYDGDLKDARVGANISESGLAWAGFEWGGKQALPYLWPRIRLEE